MVMRSRSRGQIAAVLAVVLAATLVVTLAALGREPAKRRAALAGSRPNIVVILVDDQPALDGRLIATEPTVKSIFADHGLTFTDFHDETPLCCPARAGYLTGQHTDNHGVVRNDASLFKPQMSIATQLHGVGYTTLLVGKYFNLWGKCCAPTVPPGWDHFTAFGQPAGEGGAYYNYTLFTDGSATPEVHGSTPADYSTDVLSAKAVADLHAAPAGQPVFLWLTPFAPHQKLTPAPRYLTDPRCNAVARWDPPNFNEADVSDKPLWVQNTPLITGLTGRTGHPVTGLCRTLLAVDDMVGAVRDELAREGRLADTLLIYAGDNGVSEGEHRLLQKQSPYTTDMPFLLSWPNGIGTTPRTVGDRVENIDLAPTLCELAGCTMGPYPNGQATPDGISFVPLLTGATTLGRDAVLEDERVTKSGGSPSVPPTWFSITTTSSSPLATLGCSTAASGGCRWHYTEYKDGERELYDISNGPCWTWTPGSAGDPCELANRAGDPALASVQAALATRLAQLKVQKGQ
jgi:arylsulfatase A-like enzyme